MKKIKSKEPRLRRDVPLIFMKSKIQYDLLRITQEEEREREQKELAWREDLRVFQERFGVIGQ